MLEPLSCCETAGRFRPLLSELVTLLQGLRPDDWDRPTVAPRWRVRDVVAHLFDIDVRKVAVYRDDHALPSDGRIESEGDLSRFINGLNASGVAYAHRLSPRLLTDLVELTGRWVADVIEALPPHGPARFPVSWAGETASENWMDIGREYTERWHHQAQIRDAVGIPRLLAPEWMMPLLDISVRVLPRVYSTVDAAVGSTVTLAVDGETRAWWSVRREESGWRVFSGTIEAPDATVHVAADTAWRLFYNALSADAAVDRIRIDGNRGLAQPMLQARSVIL